MLNLFLFSMIMGKLFFKLFMFVFPFYSLQVLLSAGASPLCESAISPLVSSSTSINPPIMCCNHTHPTLGYLLFAPYTIPLVSGPFFLQKYCIATNSIPPASG